MSSGGADLPDRTTAGPPQPVDASAPAEPAADPALMERVLRETLAATDSGQPYDRRELAALRGVFRRHSAEPFGPRPVAAEMVEAILRVRLGGRFRASGTGSAMAAQIAETLCDDPVSGERLKALWVRLGGE
jgi:hypothetical protein